ncbi:hypothetical protein BDR04DRAFT_226052 [Suillus decipiens]|nr:hypothetical protein BDR04DRAFT_226052 [Suillus decipiens]
MVFTSHSENGQHTSHTLSQSVTFPILPALFFLSCPWCNYNVTLDTIMRWLIPSCLVLKIPPPFGTGLVQPVRRCTVTKFQ